MLKSKSFKKIIFSLLIISVFTIIFLRYRDSKIEKNLDLENIQYLDKADIVDLYKDIERFKNKGIKLEAKVFNVERYDKDIYLQASININGKNKNALIAYYGSDLDIKKEDTIFVDGIIQGYFEGKNKLGTIIRTPTILALDIETN